jgi:hypothetical protein
MAVDGSVTPRKAAGRAGLHETGKGGGRASSVGKKFLAGLKQLMREMVSGRKGGEESVCGWRGLGKIREGGSSSGCGMWAPFGRGTGVRGVDTQTAPGPARFISVPLHPIHPSLLPLAPVPFRPPPTPPLSVQATTHPYFIRCIKPNHSLLPNEFNGAAVLRQLQCAGTSQCVTLMKEGFPIRTPYLDLRGRFRGALPDFMHEMEPGENETKHPARTHAAQDSAR